MTNLLKTVALISMVLATTKLKAHEPQLSSFALIEQTAGDWIIKINASITAFQYELELSKENTFYSNIDEFKELLLEHIEENIHLTMNRHIKPTLSEGSVLIDRSTTVSFKLDGVPEKIEEVSLKNESLTNVNSSQYIFSIHKLGLEAKDFLVSNAANEQISASITEDGITSIDNPVNYNFSSISILATAVGLLVFIIAKGQKPSSRKSAVYHY
jgi:regulator of replication initiation timing